MPNNFDIDDFEVFSTIDKTNLSDIYFQIKEQIDEIPWIELEKRELIDKKRKVSSLAPLLIYMDFQEIREGFFRKADGSSIISSKLWLSEVKMRANKEEIENPIKISFNQSKINKEFLTNIARMSKKVDNILNIKNYLREYGIILVYIENLSKAKVDGAIGRNISGNPFIGLSLRYSRLDHFWFTLLHELSHLYLHFEGLTQPIIDDMDENSVEQNEIEATRLTREAIVPRRIWNRSEPVFDPLASDEVIIKFSNDMGVHPALIAGRLQYEKKRFDKYRNITDEVDVRKLIWKNL